MQSRGSWALFFFLAACPGGDDAETSAGEGGQTQDSGMVETTAGPGTMSTSDEQTSGSQTSGGNSCASVNEGDPCDTPGAMCSYGDDCGSSDYLCQDGTWAHVGGSTCGAPAVPCADGPADGDNCDGQEVCDPDGDCADVLECIAGVWAFFAVCSEDFCADAQPADGEACDEPGRQCPEPCVVGQPSYFCTTEGWTEQGECMR